jgi:hypothetical protein
VAAIVTSKVAELQNRLFTTAAIRQARMESKERSPKADIVKKRGSEAKATTPCYRSSTSTT